MFISWKKLRGWNWKENISNVYFGLKSMSCCLRGRKFIISYVQSFLLLFIFKLAVRGAGKNFYFLFVHSSSECLEKTKEKWVSYDGSGSALLDTSQVTTLSISTSREEIICKNRFNFKFIFLAFTLHRHVYNIDFDIIAIIPETMMCFFHLRFSAIYLLS